MTYGDNDNISNTDVGYTANSGKGRLTNLTTLNTTTQVGSSAMYTTFGRR